MAAADDSKTYFSSTTDNDSDSDVDEKLKDFLGTEVDEIEAGKGKEKGEPEEGEGKVTPAPAFDKEEFTEAVTERIVERLSGKTAGEIEERPIWEKEKRQPASYREIADYASSVAEKKITAVLTEKEKEAAKKADETEAKAAEEGKNLNEYWDGQLGRLVKEGHLPEVKDPKDQNDPGKRARLDLLQLGLKNKEPNLELAYYKYMADRKKQPPGATAPVTGARKTGSGGEGEYSYEEVHNTPIRELVRESSPS